MPDVVSDALERELSRKEFLTTVGYAVASVMGIAGVLRLLGHRGMSGLSGGSGNRHGYGSSPYGR